MVMNTLLGEVFRFSYDEAVGRFSTILKRKGLHVRGVFHDGCRWFTPCPIITTEVGTGV
jgi:hypothetical protein